MNMFSKKKEEIDEKYLKKGATQVKDGDIDIAMNNQKEIDDKINNSGALRKYTELGKVMFGMLKDYRKGVYTNVPWFSIAAVAFVLLYVLNPLDIVPDFLPGIGYVDDFALLTVTLRFIETDLHKYLDWKLEED
ncbi:YkvA family protein [Salegentibacter salegens]|uniref:Uncharacterized membrane protein YkvA, DUF1232 family n=1 Tax=Salegentibacter salegens TaxID=143223 RepID=A0A1M7HZQ1_9FLAO|nr:YkvA family protein [Salegentibacter salegens]PRX45279.1 uncharacterized membrane protein YkvA (DUF1232 family) [Salegentibacter salegens]SHM34026.1 Uncharacterized membrane protein YkvA, DUF1232 family [Salegentibacter salegens]